MASLGDLDGRGRVRDDGVRGSDGARHCPWSDRPCDRRPGDERSTRRPRSPLRPCRADASSTCSSSATTGSVFTTNLDGTNTRPLLPGTLADLRLAGDRMDTASRASRTNPMDACHSASSMRMARVHTRFEILTRRSTWAASPGRRTRRDWPARAGTRRMPAGTGTYTVRSSDGGDALG